MRHETRVWVLPVMIGLALCGVALIPSPEPEPRPEPVLPPPVSERARNGYLHWAAITFALPAPIGPALDPRMLVADRALRREAVRDAGFLMRARAMRGRR